MTSRHPTTKVRASDAAVLAGAMIMMPYDTYRLYQVERTKSAAEVQRADLDEAIEVASRHPTAKIGTFELRPSGGHDAGRGSAPLRTDRGLHCLGLA